MNIPNPKTLNLVITWSAIIIAVSALLINGLSLLLTGDQRSLLAPAAWICSLFSQIAVICVLVCAGFMLWNVRTTSRFYAVLAGFAFFFALVSLLNNLLGILGASSEAFAFLFFVLNLLKILVFLILIIFRVIDRKGYGKSLTALAFFLLMELLTELFTHKMTLVPGSIPGLIQSYANFLGAYLPGAGSLPKIGQKSITYGFFTFFELMTALSAWRFSRNYTKSQPSGSSK